MRLICPRARVVPHKGADFATEMHVAHVAERLSGAHALQCACQPPSGVEYVQIGELSEVPCLSKGTAKRRAVFAKRIAAQGSVLPVPPPLVPRPESPAIAPGTTEFLQECLEDVFRQIEVPHDYRRGGAK